MVMAMNVVKEGGLSVSAAASKFSVPTKTLDDRVKGRLRHGSKPDVSTVLSYTEEDTLESCLIYMADRGFPLTCTVVKAFAWSIAKKLLPRSSARLDVIMKNMDQVRSGSCCLNRGILDFPRLSLRRSDPLDRIVPKL